MGDLSTIDLGASVVKVVETGTLFAFMFLVIVGLCYFVKYLLAELKETRKESTASMLKFVEVVAELKEIIRAALHQKN